MQYQLSLWLGIMAVFFLVILPASTETLIRLIAGYIVYLIFKEIFAPSVEKGKKAEQLYRSTWTRLKQTVGSGSSAGSGKDSPPPGE